MKNLKINLRFVSYVLSIPAWILFVTVVASLVFNCDFSQVYLAGDIYCSNASANDFMEFLVSISLILFFTFWLWGLAGIILSIKFFRKDILASKGKKKKQQKKPLYKIPSFYALLPYILVLISYIFLILRATFASFI